MTITELIEKLKEFEKYEFAPVIIQTDEYEYEAIEIYYEYGKIVIELE